MKRFVILLLSVFVITACQSKGRAVVTPESLVSSSTENVSFALANDTSIDAVSNWISGDMPSKAVLSCGEGDFLCGDAKNLMQSNSIPFEVSNAEMGAGSVILYYNRVSAKDCKSEALGCSVSVNTVQMVTDRSNFKEPSLTDFPDAAKAVQNYRAYQAQ